MTMEAEEDRVIRREDAARMVGLSVSQVDRRAGKDFPVKVKLSHRSSGFMRSELLAWIESRKAA